MSSTSSQAPEISCKEWQQQAADAAEQVTYRSRNTSTLGFRGFSDISLDYDSHPWTEDGSLTGNSVFLFEPSH